MNLENSKLLQILIDLAREQKEKLQHKILTPNHFVLAMIMYFEDSSKNTADVNKDEVEKVRQFVAKLLENRTSAECIEILSKQNDNFVNDLNMRTALNTAKLRAQVAKEYEIAAHYVVESLFETPTAEMTEVLPDVSQSDQKNVDDHAAAVEALTKMFEQSRRKKEQQTSTSEDTPEEEEPKGKIDVKEALLEVTDKAKEMRAFLRSKVFGQDYAIDRVISGYFQSELAKHINKDKSGPSATFLFAGPPGVGKTLLSKMIPKALGDLPFKRFDMSEYSTDEASMEFLGTNPAYKGDRVGVFAQYVLRHPKCVLLFDEIEKAHISVIHLFLQILDAGKFRDTNLNRDIDFSKTILIFTTNAGRMLYEDSLSLNMSNISRKTILKALEDDVDPKSGKSVFPAALCSRFATGNVVMFNHMEAHILRQIVENEMTARKEAFEESTNIRCNIEDEVFSCVLFAEGGHADARTVTSRANAFFSEELYELFRLLKGCSSTTDVNNIEEINICVDIPDDEHIKALFERESRARILVFADEDSCSKIKTAYNNAEVIVASDYDDAFDKLKYESVDFVFCDLHYRMSEQQRGAINVEDICSEGRDFFKHATSTNTPVYVLQNSNVYADEEEVSLLSDGARGIIDVADTEKLSEVMLELLTQLHHQNSMVKLAKARKYVTYETSQSVSDDGKVATISLFDLKLMTAVAAEDKSSILNSMSRPDVRFEDVIGVDSAIDELNFFVSYLKNPKRFAVKGMSVPKGVLFYGPPGTGKTMLAKAVAGESDVTFIAAEGNQFRKKYIGEGEAAVHSLFATARKYAPSIIFVDEIDAIAKERVGGSDNSGAESILTAFLAEMDGFKTNSDKPVFVIGATNFEVEPGSPKSLDQAMLRRFDRHLFIDLPGKDDRIKFMNRKVSDSNVFNLSENEIKDIAVRSTGMSLANLGTIFDFALRIALRKDKDFVDDEIFEEAFETFIYGDEKKWDESHVRKTAYHEAGHAFMCWYSGETPAYLTIVSRGNHGGYMHHGDTENVGTHTKQMLIDNIRTSLGGRAAELVFFGDDDGLSTGASSDLAHATSVAKSIVCRFGMDEKFGLSVLLPDDVVDGALAQEIRACVNSILSRELVYTKNLIAENRAAIDKIVEALLEKNHLGSQDIDDIFSSCATKRG